MDALDELLASYSDFEYRMTEKFAEKANSSKLKETRIDLMVE